MRDIFILILCVVLLYALSNSGLKVTINDKDYTLKIGTTSVKEECDKHGAFFASQC